MASYLLVVGLVFLPSFLYLRVFQREELRRRAATELVSEARIIGDRIQATPQERLAPTLSELARLVPQHFTVIRADGEVLVDSLSSPPYANQRQQPEVKQALESPEGIGEAVRTRDGTSLSYLQVAVRFPAEGTARGVVRLAVATATLDAASSSGAGIVNRAGALALSAAVILALIAAIVVSRPLKRITESARAFAAGDFGHPIASDANDELGDASRALGELASQLRDRLLASGADRAALHALLDDLPVGVILYDPKREPFLIGARAREICELSPHADLERARQIARLGTQNWAVERLLKEGLTTESHLELPWRPGITLQARWIALFSPEGERQPALVVVEAPAEVAQLSQLHEFLRALSDRVRTAARRATNAAVANDLSMIAEEIDAELAPPTPDVAELEAVGVADLCRSVESELAALTQSGGIRVELSLDEPGVRVVEAAGRTRGAVRALLVDALRQSTRGQVVLLRGELSNRKVRLSVRTPRPATGVTRFERALGGLGAETGTVRDGEGCLTWLDLPRA